MSIAQHTKKTFKQYSNEFKKNIFCQKLIAVEFCENMNKIICSKRSSLPKYNGEETVRIKGLHYVDQWFDTQKTYAIYEIVI